MSVIYRGSRKHILDWTSLEVATFLASLNDLLRPSGAERRLSAARRPG